MTMRIKTADEIGEGQTIEKGGSENRQIESRRVLSTKLRCLLEIYSHHSSYSAQIVLSALGVSQLIRSIFVNRVTHHRTEA